MLKILNTYYDSKIHSNFLKQNYHYHSLLLVLHNTYTVLNMSISSLAVSFQFYIQI